MIFIQLIVTFILITCGLIVKEYPNLIAGYNSLSEDEKNKIDIDRLSSFLKHLFLALGLINFILYIVLHWFGVNDYFVILINCSLIVTVIIAGAIYANSAFKKEI